MGSRVFGSVASEYQPVADAFAQVLARDDGLGAACTVYVDGKPVVDVWGGLADRRTGAEWARDTLALTFSTTKGVAAIALHHLVDRGLLDLDERVAHYWPEFAQAGKANVLVRWVLSHQAGLPEVTGMMSREDYLAGRPIARMLAAQAPAWPPGTAHAYHARTFGWLVGELVYRVAGVSLGRYLAESIARPLELDYYIGLPPEVEPRVARLEVLAPPPEAGRHRSDIPGLPGDPSDEMWNSRALRAAELPSTNGIGDARSLARLYAACIGEVDGVRVLDPGTLEAACRVQAHGPDRLSGAPSAYGAGFAVPPSLPPMVSRRAFGHGGAGGSMALADPARRLAFAFVMNGLRLDVVEDRRARALLDALYGVAA